MGTQNPQSHSLSCDSPTGHYGRCQPRIHRCTSACHITWQIEDEDGEFLAELEDKAAVGQMVERAAAERIWLQVHEVCNGPR